MNLYELTYLITPELTNKEVAEFNDEITELLKGAGASLCGINSPKKRNLAYEIDSKNEAYLASIDLEMDSEKIKLIEEKMKKEDKIIRHLMVSKEFIEEEEEPKETTKEEKEEKEEGEGEGEGEEDKKEEKEEKEEEEKEKDKKDKKNKKVKLNEIDEKIDEIL